MTEKLPEQESSPELKIFNFGSSYFEGGLPGDLLNAITGIRSTLGLYEEGVRSEEEVRDRLNNAMTFEEYFRSQIKKHNKEEVLYDEETSLRDGIEKIDPELIKEFDEQIDKLRKLAKRKKIITEEEFDKKIVSKFSRLIEQKPEK